MAPEGRAMGILQRSSSLIQLLAERGPLSTAEVAEEIGMPRPSVYRLADALTQTRLVESAPDGKLRLSLRWLKLSDAARSGMREWSQRTAASGRIGRPDRADDLSQRSAG